MNKKIFDFIKLLLEKEPPSKDRTEIIKFYTLPRNTTVRPMIEQPDEEVRKQLGTVQRKTPQQMYDEEHPEEVQEKEAIKKTLKGRI
jgi:hypothetical protein